MLPFANISSTSWFPHSSICTPIKPADREAFLMGERDALSAALAEMQTQHTALSETVETVVRMLLEKRQAGASTRTRARVGTKAMIDWWQEK